MAAHDGYLPVYFGDNESNCSFWFNDGIRARTAYGNIPNLLIRIRFNHSHKFNGCVRFPVFDAGYGFYMAYSYSSASSGAGCFAYCENFNAIVEIPDGTYGGQYTFANCHKFNKPIHLSNNFNDCYNMFQNCYLFNQPLVLPTKLNRASYMFAECFNFNSPVDFSHALNITSLHGMFWNCNNFNQPVNLILSADCDIGYMFYNCANFNQPVTIMSAGNNTAVNINLPGGFFYNCVSFNSPVTISNVVWPDLSYMFTFHNTPNYNTPVNIHVGAENCSRMFCNLPNFDAPVNISNTVTNCYGMFSGCLNFNKSVDIPESVINAAHMFENCQNFNGRVTISSGNTDIRGMFINCYSFNQPVYVPDGVDLTRCTNLLNRCARYNSSVSIPTSVINVTVNNSVEQREMFPTSYLGLPPYPSTTLAMSQALNYPDGGIFNTYMTVNNYDLILQYIYDTNYVNNNSRYHNYGLYYNTYNVSVNMLDYLGKTITVRDTGLTARLVNMPVLVGHSYPVYNYEEIIVNGICWKYGDKYTTPIISKEDVPWL